jgi:hypothetical protein
VFEHGFSLLFVEKEPSSFPVLFLPLFSPSFVSLTFPKGKGQGKEGFQPSLPCPLIPPKVGGEKVVRCPYFEEKEGFLRREGVKVEDHPQEGLSLGVF